MSDLEEGKAARQFAILQQFAEDSAFDHYEISNLAKPFHHAVHNSNYWKNSSYLGVGPSAHSYNGEERSWNVAHNVQYVKSIEEGMLPLTRERLTARDGYNELVMTRLRTSVGLAKAELEQMGDPWLSHFRKSCLGLLASGEIIETDQYYRISRSARFRADGISAQLFDA